MRHGLFARHVCLIATALLIYAVLLTAATGIIVSFTPAGSVHSEATGINLAGTVAGNFVDGGGVIHGYLRSSSSTVTVVDEPAAGTQANDGTWIFGINDAGETTGSYTCTNSSGNVEPCGFFRDQYGSFTTFVAPNAVRTWGQGINNSGVIAGGYSPNEGGTIAGFVRDTSGNFTEFEVPNAGNTWVIAINASSQVVGYFTNDSDHGFVRTSSGVIRTFDAPQATHTYAVAINNNGEVVGYHVDSTDSNAVRHAFYRDSAGNITSFDVPGAGNGDGQGTYATGINAAGTIAGYYTDSNSVSHGFVRTSSGTITSFDDPNAGTQSGQGTYAYYINRMGQIAGSFSGVKGQVRSFLRK